MSNESGTASSFPTPRKTRNEIAKSARKLWRCYDHDQPPVERVGVGAASNLYQIGFPVPSAPFFAPLLLNRLDPVGPVQAWVSPMAHLGLRLTWRGRSGAVGQVLPPVLVWWREFAARSVGALCLRALLRGQWVEIDRDRLQRAMARFRHAQERARGEGLTLAEAMRLLAAAPVATNGPDSAYSGSAYSGRPSTEDRHAVWNPSDIYTLDDDDDEAARALC